MLLNRRWSALPVSLWLAAVAAPAMAAPGDVNHAPWDALTEKYVADGRVDYAGVAKDRQLLSTYTVSLREADPSKLPSKPAQLAFWINAYNACVFKGVLDHRPIQSVKDVKGFFDRLTYRVAGRDLTLNEIESAGRALGDWRIHFAVVCASASCPPIRSEAYTAEWLDAQLTEQVKRFLGNRRDGLRIEGSTLWASPIFKWYAKDFVQGTMTADSLAAVLGQYLSPDILQAIRGRKLALRFLHYDWSLNSRVPQPPESR